MSKNLLSLRARYTEVRAFATNSEIKKADRAYVAKCNEDTQKQIDQMQRTNQFENLEEVGFYQEKFGQLTNTLNNAIKNKLTIKVYTQQVREIFKEQKFIAAGSKIKQSNTEQPSQLKSQVKSKIGQQIKPKNGQSFMLNTQSPQNVPFAPQQLQINSNVKQPQYPIESNPQTKLLQSFFQQKRSKIAPQAAFRSVLQNVPTANRNFKKKIATNDNQITKLHQQNQQLRRKLQSKGQLGSKQKQLQSEIRKQQEQIHFLEKQNEILRQDNNKLKTQRMSESSSQQNKQQSQKYNHLKYQPYGYHVRENDLMKITKKTNFNVDQMQRNGKVQGQFMDNSHPPIPNHTIFKANLEYSQNKRYSVFDSAISESSYGVSQDQFHHRNGIGIQDNRTVYRNKKAFFKPEGILIREKDFDIAYKRYENSSITNNRIILYFNNKSKSMRQIDIKYQYEPTYYQIRVTQKLSEVKGLDQNHEVIQIDLMNGKDLNSIIEMEFIVDGVRMNLWLPAVFMKFHSGDSFNGENYGKLNKKVIYPSPIFGNPKEAGKILYWMSYMKQGDYGFVAQTKLGIKLIKLIWRADDKLEVIAAPQLSDFIGFLLLNYN